MLGILTKPGSNKVRGQRHTRSGGGIVLDPSVLLLLMGESVQF